MFTIPWYEVQYLFDHTENPLNVSKVMKKSAIYLHYRPSVSVRRFVIFNVINMISQCSSADSQHDSETFYEIQFGAVFVEI